MEQFTIKFMSSKEGRNFRIKDLAEFLSALNFYYEAAQVFLATKKGDFFLHFSEMGYVFSHGYDVDEFKYFLRSSGFKGNLAALNSSYFEPLEFTSITTNSPLKFIGYCSGASFLALSLAVAIAGGEADLTNKTFKVEPLSDAIIKMHKEFKNVNEK